MTTKDREYAWGSAFAWADYWTSTDEAVDFANHYVNEIEKNEALYNILEWPTYETTFSKWKAGRGRLPADSRLRQLLAEAFTEEGRKDVLLIMSDLLVDLDLDEVAHAVRWMADNNKFPAVMSYKEKFGYLWLRQKDLGCFKSETMLPGELGEQLMAGVYHPTKEAALWEGISYLSHRLMLMEGRVRAKVARFLSPIRAAIGERRV